MSKATHKVTGVEPLPLCVDLDGTLVRTDMLMETALIEVKQSSGSLLTMLKWLRLGRAHFKNEVAKRAPFDPANLPYRLPLLDYLRRQREQGRKIVLVTASDDTVANAIAAHLGLSDEVIASDGQKNVKGAVKARVLSDRAIQFSAKGCQSSPK